MSTSRCDEVFARLSEYLDREMTVGSCEELEKHIAGCAPCVQFLDSLKKSIELTHGLEETAPPPLSEDSKRELRAAFDRMVESRRSTL